jgi:hypothetical protein
MSGNPANGRVPFDLDAAAAKAAADEALAVPFAFTWEGRTYELPPQGKWPMRAVKALAGGDLNTAMAMLLGEKDYSELCDTDMTLGDMGVLFAAIGEGAGMGGLPNSSPPARAGSTPT